MQFEVEGMTCSHCAQTVTAAVKGAAPAAQVQIDLETGRVSVTGGDDRRDAVAAAIKEAGYAVKA
ncbi:heavy-metal-associated domain-containing protein [Phenylobacterium koreense]|uniref:Copper chaperone n=1 Tax=Phenylobacterium koreense TaxID=266125 RepID=A0ABV2EF28_9CAUL